MPQSHVCWLIVLVLVFLALYTVVGTRFTIEDAGMSFAYARNLADGHGLVAYPGGAHVEGYSNPLWTFLLSGFALLGGSPRTAALGLGAVFGALSLPLGYWVTVRARPGAGEVALLASALLAGSSQFVIWSASGLETSLFVFLLPAGLALPLRWSWIPLALLAMTRPEGIVYGVLLFVATRGTRSGEWRPALRWLACFLLPLLVFEVWRLAYFAWPLPNTYYAKLGGESGFEPWSWDAKGWSYIAGWFQDHSAWLVLPAVPLAITGLRGRRAWAAGGATAVLGILVLVDSDRFGAAHIWEPLRTLAIGAVALVVPLFAHRGEGVSTRRTLWLWAAFAVFFALYAGGDWMRAHRWFAFLIPSLVILVAVGLSELAGALRPGRWVLRLGAAGTVLVWAVSEATLIAVFLQDPEITIDDVRKRVRYFEGVRQQLRMGHVVLADVDMGAPLFYSGWEVVDYAGLADPVFGHNQDYEPTLVTTYLLGERRPDFIHIHAGWARRTGLTALPAFREGYLPIPPYVGRKGKSHPGNYVRRDLLVRSIGSAPDGAPRAGDVVLTELELDATTVSPTGHLTGELLLQTARLGPDFDLLLLVVDTEGNHVAERIWPGWDWYPPSRWVPGERVFVPIDVSLRGLPAGDYELRLAIGPSDRAIEFDIDVPIVVAPRAEAAEPAPAGFQPRFSPLAAWERREIELARVHGAGVEEAKPAGSPVHARSERGGTETGLRSDVVLIIVDTLRADHLGAWGYERPTSPTLDALAGEGVRFSQFYSTSSWTRPAMASMLTGLYAREVGVYEERYDVLPQDVVTLPERLQSVGYRTLGVTSNPNINAWFGFDQGFDAYLDRGASESNRF